MILTAHQVGYLPWIGFFDKLSRADLFVSFDAVQYERRGWTNRNYIKTHTGPLMLSVPVMSKNHFETRLCDIEIQPGNWARKHMRSIELAYMHAPHFEQHYAGVGAILDMHAQGAKLCELNLDLLRYFMQALGIQVPIVRASDYAFVGSKSQLVLDMCLKLRATKYIFGGQGEGYADKDGFRRSGVEPIFQVYRHPVYPQLHGSFVPNMGIFDLLANCGQESLAILKGEKIEQPA